MKPQELLKSDEIKTPEKSGVYMLYCINSDRALIGSSKKIKRRWNEHRSCLKQNKHRNPHLQNSYNKYGKDSLIYYVIENCEESIRYDREAYFINKLNIDARLNLAAVTQGYRTTDETRKKMSESAKGRVPWNKGKKDVYSKEILEQMSLAKRNNVPWLKGRKVSKETKEKLSNIMKNQKTIIRDSLGRIKNIIERTV